MKITEKLAETSSLTQEQRERVTQNVEAFVKAANSDPKFREEVMKKLSFDSSIFPDIAKTLAFMATAAAIEIGAKSGYDLYKGLKDKIEAKTNYESMLKHNPDLKKYDDDRVRAAFNTLQKFNPDYASDPHVSGTFVQNAIDMARTDLSTINTLVDARHKMKSQPPDFLTVAPFLQQQGDSGRRR